MKKAVSALVLAGALAFAGTSAATANTYPAPPVEVTGSVSAGVVTPGDTVTFSGTGFIPGEIIDITVDYDNDPNIVGGTGVNGLIILNQRVAAFTTTATTDGTFSTQVTLGEVGTYTLTATGRDSGHTVTAVVTVKADEAAGVGNNASDKDGLADTGADSAMMLWGAAGGVLALGAGAAAIAVSRRKQA